MRRSATWSVGLVALLLPWGLPWTEDAEEPAAAAVQGPRDHPGSWQYISAPIGAIHAAVLPDGKVLLYAFSNTNLFDPATRAFSPGKDSHTNVFCSGMAMMADGRMLAVGGTLAYDAQGFHGQRYAEAFIPGGRGDWALLANMSEPRWYPTAVTLAHGEVAAFGGLIGPEGLARHIEVYNPMTGTWDLRGRGSFDLLQRAHLMPDGTVFLGSPQGATLSWDPVTGMVSTIANRPSGYRGGGASVMLDSATGRVLVLGGDPNYATSEIWEPGSNAWRAGPRMSYPRVWPDATLLPNGDVLVVGGELNPFAADDGHGHDHGLHGLSPLDARPDLPPELYPQGSQPAEYYDVETDTFTVVAQQARPRQYHSEGLLLPDGSVLEAGPEASVEIYKPWYFFAGPRPMLTSAPDVLVYGEPFAVATPDAARVGRAVLMRLGSVTHSHSSDQRLVEVPLLDTPVPGQLLLQAPVLPTVAPPGYYMLFLLDGNGVPSTSDIVRLAPGLGLA